MAKRTAPVLVLVLLYTTGYTQNVTTDTSATCVTYWKKGEVKTAFIKRTKITKGPGSKPGNSTYACEATITVLDSTDTNYIIQWQYKPIKGDPIAADDEMNRLFADLKIIYRISETGIYDSLLNFEEVRIAIGKSIQLLASRGKSDTAMMRILNQFTPIMQSRVTIENIFLQDITMYHAPYGVEYSSKTPTIAETEIPNIFGGEPFPAIMKLSLIKLEPAKNTALIGIDQDVDKEKAGKILAEIIKSFAPGAPPEDMDIPPIEISDQFRYDLSLSDGWIKRMYRKRTVKAPKGRANIETTEILIK